MKKLFLGIVLAFLPLISSIPARAEVDNFNLHDVLVYRNINLSTTGQVVKASAGQLTGYYFSNSGASVRYVKVYNKATAATQADTPILTFMIPPSGGANLSLDGGFHVSFSAGISVRATTGAADADVGAPGANEVMVNVLYK